MFDHSFAGRQCRPGGVIIADRKFAPRPGTHLIAVEGARPKVFAQPLGPDELFALEASALDFPSQVDDIFILLADVDPVELARLK